MTKKKGEGISYHFTAAAITTCTLGLGMMQRPD